jgi:hypothetical protein
MIRRGNGNGPLLPVNYTDVFDCLIILSHPKLVNSSLGSEKTQNETKYMVKKQKLNKIPGKKSKRGQTKLSA